MMLRRALVVVCVLAGAGRAEPISALTTTAAGHAAPRQRHDGAHARVTFGTAGRMSRQVIGRREEPLTPEEDTARQIEKLLRGPLRVGVTAIYVANAKTGAPLFAVNADDALNPASNIKMLSTAAALDLMGPDFRYATRLLGAAPDAAGVIHGDVYLLGSYDPTLVAADYDEIGAQLAARGVRQLDGNVVVGADPERDGLPDAVVPIDIIAGEPNQAPVAVSPPGFDFVALRVGATTARTPQRARLSYAADATVDPQGHRRITLTITGTIGQTGVVTYPLALRERAVAAAHFVRAALRAHSVVVTGDVAIADFNQYLAARGNVPVPELARHDSARLADIVARVNKRSINWLADRVIMTTAGMARGEAPSMTVALAAMYNWLAQHPHVDKSHARLDSGSGLSYYTRVTARDLVSIVRSAGGFADAADPRLGAAWLGSLAVSGTDGTLAGRLRTPEVRGRIRGKTGTLSTAIALSGVLDLDPERPLAFSIVTNGDRPLRKGRIRKAHDQIVGALCNYVVKTAKVAIAPLPLPIVDHTVVPDDFEDTESEPEPDIKSPQATIDRPQTN